MVESHIKSHCTDTYLRYNTYLYIFPFLDTRIVLQLANFTVLSVRVHNREMWFVRFSYPYVLCRFLEVGRTYNLNVGGAQR